MDFMQLWPALTWEQARSLSPNFRISRPGGLYVVGHNWTRSRVELQFFPIVAVINTLVTVLLPLGSPAF